MATNAENTGGLKISGWTVAGALVALVLTILCSITLWVVGSARAEVVGLSGSVVSHHTDDASRDSTCAANVAAVSARMDRIETMAERMSYRLGVEVPPRTDRPHRGGAEPQ